MKKQFNLGEILLENNRVYWKRHDNIQETKVDITPVWHFFQELEEWKRQGKPEE